MYKFMVVDDSEVVRRNLKYIICEMGHRVVCEATNGEEAVQEYKKHRPDLVTMDISMPKQDGITTVKLIIEEDPNANIIMVTALSQQSMVYKAIKYGAKNYIVKPIKIEKVKNVINEVIANMETIARKPSVKLTSENGHGIPFEVENVGIGKFRVIFSDSLDIGNLETLEAIIKGFLLMKSPEICFAFPSFFSSNDPSLRKMAGIFEIVQSAGGMLTVDYDGDEPRLRDFFINMGF